MIIYKIVTAEQWRTAEAAGTFTGAPIDVTDGYIHFSTAEQWRETLAKHFAGQHDLLDRRFVAAHFDELALHAPTRLLFSRHGRSHSSNG